MKRTFLLFEIIDQLNKEEMELFQNTLIKMWFSVFEVDKTLINRHPPEIMEEISRNMDLHLKQQKNISIQNIAFIYQLIEDCYYVAKKRFQILNRN
ncbi:MAG: hypothetical protein ACFFD1_07100 [Candidatus Thorarchaeota archaeon]